VRATIAKTFGNDVQNPDGSINKKILGPIVFSDLQKLKTLNEIMAMPMNVRMRRVMMNKQ
jgi:dephospho-CoA kinase